MSCQLNFFYVLLIGIGSGIRKQGSLPYLLMCFIILFSGVSGCTNRDGIDTRHHSDNLVVACTIPPQEEFIKEVGGNATRILVMVPPGASPHTFEPAPSQIAELESADLYIYLGSGIEFENRWLDRIRSMYPNLSLVNASENITFFIDDDAKTIEESSADRTDYEHHSDPHVWLSLKNAGLMVNTTCNALSNLRPGLRNQFEQNRDSYLSRLIIRDKEIQSVLADLPSRNILVYHPAFGYFCREYNLTQISVEEDGKEPSAKSLASLIAAARSDNISFVFTEPETSSMGAETLAAEINASVILMSPLSGEYLKNMQYISDSIAGR